MDFIVRTRRIGFEPNADVFIDEENGLVVVTVELPGADPESIRVAVDDRRLSIVGRRGEPERRYGSWVQKEIAYGEFAKPIALPVPVEYQGAVARYDDGFLTIALPISSTAYLPTARTEMRITVQRTVS
jgi:HSP20 family protein